MKTKIIVTTLWDKLLPEYRKEKGTVVVSTVSKSTGWEKGLSPFILGPCNLYKHKGKMLVSQNMENAWQYSKCYKPHANDDLDNVDKTWWIWAKAGWQRTAAIRYPMGKGASPLFSYWDKRILSYVEARKVIYGPLYSHAVLTTTAWAKLKELYKTSRKIVLLDFDARDTDETLSDVLNNPNKKMGHAFVLSMLLQKDKALKEMEM